MLRTTGTPPIVLHHKHCVLVRHLFILCALTSVAGVTERLEILNIETRSTFVDRHDMVYHLGGCQAIRFEALLAHRLLLQLQGSELSPGRALVELCVVMAVALEGFSLRLPRSLCSLLNRWHQSMILELSGTSVLSVRKPLTRIIFVRGNFRANSSAENAKCSKSSV